MISRVGTSPWPYRLLSILGTVKLKESQSAILSGTESRQGPSGSTGNNNSGDMEQGTVWKTILSHTTDVAR